MEDASEIPARWLTLGLGGYDPGVEVSNHSDKSSNPSLEESSQSEIKKIIHSADHDSTTCNLEGSPSPPQSVIHEAREDNLMVCRSPARGSPVRIDQEAANEHIVRPSLCVISRLNKSKRKFTTCESSSSRARKKYKFTDEQLALLEESFRSQENPNMIQKMKLSQLLDLELRKVEVWFQNRRVRTKQKQNVEFNQKLLEDNRLLKEENKDLRRHLRECYKLMEEAKLSTPDPPKGLIIYNL